jgi:hypothetical protein
MEIFYGLSQIVVGRKDVLVTFGVMEMVQVLYQALKIMK